MSVIATSTLGEHRQFPLSPPLDVIAGDVLTTNGRTLYLIRDGLVIETRETSGNGTLFVPPPITEAQTLDSVLFFKEKRMPGQNVSMTGVSENTTSGAVYCRMRCMSSLGSPTESPPIAKPSKPIASRPASDSLRKSSNMPPCTIPKRALVLPSCAIRDRAAQRRSELEQRWRLIPPFRRRWRSTADC